MRSMARRWAWRSLLPLALGVFILGLAGLLAYARWTDQDLAESWRQLDQRVLPVALGLHVLAHIFWALRMSLLSGPSGAPLRFGSAWHLLTAGVFGGAVTPGRIGGEALKLTLLVRRRNRLALEGPSVVPATAAARLLLVDRAADLFFFVMTGMGAFFLVPWLFGGDNGKAQAFAAAGAGMLILFLVLLATILRRPSAAGTLAQAVANVARLWRRRPDVRSRVTGFVDEVRAGLGGLVRRHPFHAAGAFLLTLLNWVSEYAVLWVLLGAFGHDVPYLAVFLVGTILTLVSNIPLTPGGAAVAEFAAYALLLPMAPGLTILFPVVWRSVTYLYDVVVGGVVAALALPGAFSRDSRQPGPTR